VIEVLSSREKDRLAGTLARIRNRNVALDEAILSKVSAIMQEVRARGGKIVLISDAKGIAEAGEGCMATIEMPEVHPLIAPLVYAVPVQLLAYHVAVLKGTDIDQPRNDANNQPVIVVASTST